jgi:hypothetical protein
MSRKSRWDTSATGRGISTTKENINAVTEDSKEEYREINREN